MKLLVSEIIRLSDSLREAYQLALKLNLDMTAKGIEDVMGDFDDLTVDLNDTPSLVAPVVNATARREAAFPATELEPSLVPREVEVDSAIDMYLKVLALFGLDPKRYEVKALADLIGSRRPLQNPKRGYTHRCAAKGCAVGVRENVICKSHQRAFETRLIRLGVMQPPADWKYKLRPHRQLDALFRKNFLEKH